MEDAQEPVASSGIPFHLWRLNQHFWLVCFLFPIISLVQTPLAPLRLYPALAALVFFAASYTWLMWHHPASSGARKRSHSPLSLTLFGVLVALVLALSLIYGNAFLWLFIGVSAIAGVMLPMRSAFVAVVIFTLLPLGISVGTSGGIAQVNWLQLIPLMLLVRGIGVDMIGVARLSGAIRELHAVRGELTRLKVEEERTRLARDLHDLLGHTLSMITLKSELAGRLVEQEPARAVQEMREVERVSRQTLREVRVAVAGSRQPRLESELDGARQMLSAARVTCKVEYTLGELEPSIDAVLAWTVREGVTNVIRHSRARHCLIRLTHEHRTICAEIINDRSREQESEDAKVRTGSGLSGLNERVISLGGRMEAGLLQTEGNKSFRLWVELPIQNHRAASQEERS
jgi:two-component system sensor histidine kinase DesK